MVSFAEPATETRFYPNRKDASQRASVRLHEIDGIRGWAALVVVFFHLIWEVFGQIRPELRTPALKILLDGHLAVYVFFVLSGDALSSPFLLSKNTKYIDRQVVKRYLRLEVPILLSCLLVYLLLVGGLTYNAQAARIVDGQDWLGTFARFRPDVLRLVECSVIEVFVDTNPPNNYNAFLWPMTVELVASYIVFAYLYALPRFRAPLWATTFIAAGLFLAGRPLCLFFVGVLFAQLRAQGFWDRWRRITVVQICAPLILGVCALIDGTSEYLHSRHINGIDGTAVHWLLAAAIVFAIYGSAPLRGFFSNKLSRFLGDISFPLYILQFSVLISLTSWLIVVADRDGAISSLEIAGIVAASAIAVVLVAYPFRRLEEYLLKKVDVLVALALSPKRGRLRELEVSFKRSAS